MKNNKGFAPVLVIGIVLGVLVIGGVAYYMGTKKETPFVPVTINTDKILNWETYSDSQYRFEFKYPNAYLLTETNLGVRIQSSLSCKTIGEGGLWPKDCFSYNLSIQKNKILAEGIGIVKTTIKVAGYPAEKIQFADSENMYMQSSQALVQFKKGNDWYINTFSFNSENKVTSENLLNQIIKTFKFN